MVEKEIIEGIITDILTDDKYQWKCQPRKTIESKLSSMSSEEKYEKLGSLLIDLELKDYAHLIDAHEGLKKYNDNGAFDEEISELEEKIYKYEKRIITGEETVLPNVPFEDFKEADQTQSKYSYVSKMEEQQVKEQNKKISYDDMLDNYVDALNFFSCSYIDINTYLAKGRKYFEDLPSSNLNGETVDWWVNKTQKQVQMLDKLIKECPPLLEDTVLYRGGRLDDGVSGKFTTFTSCSYNKTVAQNFSRDDEYLIKIYAPKGTKGIVNKGKDFEFRNDMYSDTEHEFTIGRNQKYIVLEKNDEDMTATIVLV